jgi:hypothetical protein
MSLIGGVLDLASQFVSAATHGGDGGGSSDSSPKLEMKDGGKGMELDAGPLQVSLDDSGLSVKVDGKEVAKLDASKLGGKSDADGKPPAPSLDLHSADTFEAPRPPPAVKGLFDEKSGVGSKPGATGEGRA